MIAFDTTFLIDYLDGIEATVTYLDSHEEKPLLAPSLSLFEVYRGAARTGGRDQIERVAAGLDWVEPLPVTEPAVREAALVESELLAAGEPVNLGDTLIAGVCRHNGTRLVTRDEHFEQVEGLDVDSY